MHSKDYIQRCLQLAELGNANVAPNPMVGAVLVYNDRIIGEGYHQKYGEAHAEVNCLNSVSEEHRKFIRESVLYVSLEPCAHYGKTPPCADLIIVNKIPKVVIGCRDPFEAVNGKGIEKLRAAGVEVELEEGERQLKCVQINKRFFCYHTQGRPYVILKWAETANGFIAPSRTGDPRLMISNDFSKRIVHKWRSEEAAILVGTNTALRDNPALTNRYWPGPSPLRLVLDLDLKLPASLKIFDEEVTTIIFNGDKHTIGEELRMPALMAARKNFYYRISRNLPVPPQILKALHGLSVSSVLVEGGAALHQSFVNEKVWDEARVLSASEVFIQTGLKAAELKNAVLKNALRISSDSIRYYTNSMSVYSGNG